MSNIIRSGFVEYFVEVPDSDKYEDGTQCRLTVRTQIDRKFRPAVKIGCDSVGSVNEMLERLINSASNAGQLNDILCDINDASN